METRFRLFIFRMRTVDMVYFGGGDSTIHAIFCEKVPYKGLCLWRGESAYPPYLSESL